MHFLLSPPLKVCCKLELSFISSLFLSLSLGMQVQNATDSLRTDLGGAMRLREGKECYVAYLWVHSFAIFEYLSLSVL